MAKYFHISQGLRGCYMPDNSQVIKCATRRELKSALEYDADSIRDAGMVGCNKKQIAWLAAIAWREAQKPNPAYLPYVAPYRDKHQDSYPYGIFVSVATRSDYLEQSDE